MMSSRGSKNQKEQELGVKYFWEGKSFLFLLFRQFCSVPHLKCTILFFLDCLQVVFALGALFNTFWLMEVGRFIFG